tara:strand:+ start:800 stop:952 length:153 start_codon:yes stop_codon:yes gene_type:complete
LIAVVPNIKEKSVIKSSQDIKEELKKMLDDPKQDVLWEEKFKSKVRELVE